MPTTRNRWQAETQQTKTDDSKRSHNDPRRSLESAVQVNIADSAGEQSRASAIPPDDQNQEPAQDDLIPPSPKRRRLSPSEDADREAVASEHTAVPIPAAPLMSASTPTPLPEKTTLPAAPPQVSAPQVPPATQEPLKAQASTPSLQTRIDNLPILSSLSTQLLSVLGKMSSMEALQLMQNVASPHAHEYRTVRSVLDPVTKLYRTGDSFLAPSKLGLYKADQVEVLRKANQAMWLTSIFTGEIGLRDMDQFFVSVFVPEQGKLLKGQGVIFLELKTQAFITAHRLRAADPMYVLMDLFPNDTEQRLLSRRPGTKSLAPSEHDFLKRLASRRDILLGDIQNNKLDQLEARYTWADFSKEVSVYLVKNHGPSAINSQNPADNATSKTSYTFTPPIQGQMQREFSLHDPPMPKVSQSPTADSLPPPISSSLPIGLPGGGDFRAWAAQAVEIALKGLPLPSEVEEVPTPPLPQEPAPPPPPPPEVIKEPVTTTKVQSQFQHYNPSSVNGSTKASTPGPENSDIPHISQTAPTQVLYERARQAATAKATAHAHVPRKPDSPSQRRAWTQDEESALMTGLDQVKGPHWSQILAMYGRGGSINESLKDRNQVQLKDKARNLKLFFLKNGTEVPYYLKEVTGDLKTRAPGQAEKQERERLQNAEHKAHYDGLQGIMALANGDPNDLGDSVEGSLYEQEDFETEEGLDETGEATSSNPHVDVDEFEALIARAASQNAQTPLATT